MMDEPRRLLEETENSVERALLEAGSSYRSSARLRTRTLMSLGLVGSVVTGTASNASASVLAKSVWTKVLAVSAIGAVAAIPVGQDLIERYSAPEEVAPTLAPTGRPHVAPAPVVEATPDEAPAPTAAEPVEPAVENPTPTTTRAAPPARATPPKSVGANRVLTEELAILDAARSAVAAGDPRRALVLLDGYNRNYPRARLQVEAEVLRIDALRKSGQVEVARKRAEAFLRRHPNSVLAPRVRSYL